MVSMRLKKGAKMERSMNDEQKMPEGLSRAEMIEWFRDPKNHGLRLDKEGRWLRHGGLVEHPGVQRLFHQGLSVDDDGRVKLQVGDQWCWIECEDTPFFVFGIELIKGESGGVVEAKATLNDGTIVELPDGGLVISDENVLYCKVKEGRALARFSRDKQTQLLDATLEEDGAGGYAVRIGESAYPIEPREND